MYMSLYSTMPIHSTLRTDLITRQLRRYLLRIQTISSILCLGFLYRMMVQRVQFIYAFLELLPISRVFRTREQCFLILKLILVYWKTVMARVPSLYNAELDALFGMYLELVLSELQTLLHPHVLLRGRLDHQQRSRPSLLPKCRLEHLPKCRPNLLPRCRLEHLQRCRPRCRLEHLQRCRPRCRLEYLQRCRLKHRQSPLQSSRPRFLQRNRLIHQVRPVL
jgi:hypothetical protein